MFMLCSYRNLAVHANGITWPLPPGHLSWLGHAHERPRRGDLPASGEGLPHARGPARGRPGARPGIFSTIRIYHAAEDGPSRLRCGTTSPPFAWKQKFTVLAAPAESRRGPHPLPRGLGRPGSFGPWRPRRSSATASPKRPAARPSPPGWPMCWGRSAAGPLKVQAAPESWRFTDHPLSQVSIVSLTSVADLSRRLTASSSTRCASAPISTSRAGRPGRSTAGPAAS